MECVNIEQQTKQFERLMQIQSTICDTVCGQMGDYQSGRKSRIHFNQLGNYNSNNYLGIYKCINISI